MRSKLRALSLLIELGRPEPAQPVLRQLQELQADDGGLRGYEGVSWTCSTGLAQVAHLRDCKRVFTQALPPPPFPKLLQEWDIALTIAP